MIKNGDILFREVQKQWRKRVGRGGGNNPNLQHHHLAEWHYQTDMHDGFCGGGQMKRLMKRNMKQSGMSVGDGNRRWMFFEEWRDGKLAR